MESLKFIVVIVLALLSGCNYNYNEAVKENLREDAIWIEKRSSQIEDLAEQVLESDLQKITWSENGHIVVVTKDSNLKSWSGYLEDGLVSYRDGSIIPKEIKRQFDEIYKECKTLNINQIKSNSNVFIQFTDGVGLFMWLEIDEAWPEEEDLLPLKNRLYIKIKPNWYLFYGPYFVTGK